MKKHLTLLAALCLAALAAALTGSAAKAATDTVCASGCPFTSIQAAVDAASPGGTVTVAAGTYTGQIVINKALTLQGAGDTTIIRPAAPSSLATFYTYPAGTFWPGTVMAAVILVHGTGTNAVAVKDLMVDGANLSSLPAGSGRLTGVLYGESAGAITNVAVNSIKTTGYAARSYGIDVSAVGTAVPVEVGGNRVSDFSRDGIEIQGASLTANVHDNTVTGPPGTMGAGIVPNGILFIQGASGNATGNTIHGSHAANPGDGSRAAGLLAYGALGATTFAGNDVSDVDDGIQLSGSTGVVVSGNNLHGNLETGVHLENGAAANTIVGNTFADNAVAGIRFAGAADPSDIALCPVLLDCLDTPPGAGNTAQFNSFSGNGVGVVNYDTQTFDATSNWWGTVSGPGTLSGVTTRAWCTDAACSTLSDNADLGSLSLSSGTLSPAFSPSTTAYAASVGNDVTSVTTTASANPGAHAVVVGGSSLSVGDNLVDITVTSTDGTATATYTLTITRAATPADTPAPTDLCPNLGGVQVDMPNGYDLVDGGCEATTPATNAPESTPASPDQAGTDVVVVEAAPAAGTGTPPPLVTVTASWEAGTFTDFENVTVTPETEAMVPGGTTPLPIAGGFTMGGTTVQLTVTDASGARVTSFGKPIEIEVSASMAGDVPAYSLDGTTWTKIPRLSSPSLPAGQPDGYFVESNGCVDIYTRHATLFGLLKDVKAPSAPTVHAAVHGSKLYLLLKGAKDNMSVTSYQVSFNGHTIMTTAHGYLVLPARTGTVQITAIDAAGNKSKPSAPIRIVRHKSTFSVTKR